MKEDEMGLGTLVQRCALPATTGMDAMESRLIVVQEVPLKMKLQFFAVRGEDREPLTAQMARATLSSHVPRKSVGELTEVELLVEVSVLRDDVDRMTPVYEAAKAWREHRRAWPADVTADATLVEAVDVAVTVESE
jgi:hypothetical protein